MELLGKCRIIVSSPRLVDRTVMTATKTVPRIEPEGCIWRQSGPEGPRSLLRAITLGRAFHLGERPTPQALVHREQGSPLGLVYTGRHRKRLSCSVRRILFLAVAAQIPDMSQISGPNKA